jgi:hypothetical protein
MTDAEDCLLAAERIARVLEHMGIFPVVIGAVALAAYRYVRHTEDIDLGVDADLEDMRSITRALRGEGFSAELREPGQDDPLGGVIDVSGPFGLVQIVSFGGRFPAAIVDALAGEDLRVRPGSILRLVPLPQLVALKLYAGGIKSKADIVEVLRRNPDVDLAPIRQACKRYRLKGLEVLLGEI